MELVTVSTALIKAKLRLRLRTEMTAKEVIICLGYNIRNS
jgi:hypothetical protein